MQKEVEILDEIQKKIDEVEKLEADGNSQMERYKEGLLTAYTESKSILVSKFKEYCRFEDCDESSCIHCDNFISM